MATPSLRHQWDTNVVVEVNIEQCDHGTLRSISEAGMYCCGFLFTLGIKTLQATVARVGWNDDRLKLLGIPLSWLNSSDPVYSFYT